MPPAAWRSAQKQPKARSEPSTLPDPTEP
jgi:hypothetical protein